MINKATERAVELIKRFEGINTKAYLCPAQKWTIGYGHTHNVKQGDTCTIAEATQFLKNDLVGVEKTINKFVKVELTQNEFDALTSFIYNVGSGNFAKSTMLKFLNNNHKPLAAGQFDRWVYAKGKRLNGLVKRRAAEKELFLNATNKT